MTSELLYASPEHTQIGRKDFVFMLQGKKGRCLFFPTPPAIQCLEEKQERNHGDFSELREAAASSAGVALLMDSSTYRWKKPLSLSLSLSPPSFFFSLCHLLPLSYTNGRTRENFQKPQESICC